MSNYSYHTILNKAKIVKKNVKNDYKIGMTHKWSYYFAKALLNPKRDIKKIKINNAPKRSHNQISRQMSKTTYLELANKLVKFIEKNHRMPNYLKWKNYKISTQLFTYTFARCLVYYDKYGVYDKEITINQKVFNKPVESHNEVYNYFVKVFGKISSVDDALDKISGRGYGYYYDDTYSNKASIDRMKVGKGVNCTDSCQVFYNLILDFIKQGKYKKVECLHVKCSGGDGHVRLRITKNDGTKFLRDPACTLDSGGYCNWCTSNYTLLAINPSWFMANLNR